MTLVGTMFDPVKALAEFVSHPSVSTDPSAGAGMAGARDFIAGLLRNELGCEVEIIDTPLHPVVLGRRPGRPEWPHLIIYGHYDVQPADPLELWDSPPYETVVRNGRIYGRGTADNKGPQLVHIAAAARLLERRPDLPLRLTFLIEGEEEIGSPSFAEVLETHREKLSADMVLLSDSSSLGVDDFVVTTGLRGIVCMEVTLSGPKGDLHSGLHGGPVVNPIRALIELCASLHHKDGRVNVPGFYDDVIQPQDWEREELAQLGQTEEEYAAQLGVPCFSPPPGLNPFEATRFVPTLEYNGIKGGYQGEGSKTIIPSKASVKISCRLVANQEPKRIYDLVAFTLQQRCPKGVRIDIVPQHDGRPYMVVPPHKPGAPKDAPKALASAFRAADAAIRQHVGKPPHYLREGGSVPIIGDIQRVLGVDSLMIGLFTNESNLHAPNESFDLRIMERGMKVSEAILEAVADGR